MPTTPPRLTRPDLRAVRETEGISQVALARELGLTTTILSRIELGMRPSLEIAHKLVRRFPDLATLEEWRQ